MQHDTTDIAPASSRLPVEVLMDIFALLTHKQGALYSCILTCRQWNKLAIPILWKRPRFERLSHVEHFASTLVLPPLSGLQMQTSPYAKLVESLTFSTLPEVDRNSPRLATLVDSIVNCLAVAMPHEDSRLGLGVHGQYAHPAVLKRSRSLSRNDDDGSPARPYSAVDLTLDDTNAECSSAHDGTQPGAAATKQLAEQNASGGATRETSLPLMDDSQLQHCSQQPPSTAVGDWKRGSHSFVPSHTHSRGADGASSSCYTSPLRHLDLRFCKGMRNYSLQRLAPKLSSILVLNLAGGLRNDITIAKLSQHMRGLRRISLAWTSNLTDFGISELAQQCPNLEALDLTHCTQIEDTSMFAIAHNLRKLRALSVAYCAGITDIGVKEVAMRCSAIRMLSVVKCVRVSDRMRKTLEGMGIACEYSKLEPFSIDQSLDARYFP
ncbi:RNI-like protein [Martensiomyces pterosporus]|nr:RNI-like protein [Martensiomyces pterosporus]